MVSLIYSNQDQMLSKSAAKWGAGLLVVMGLSFFLFTSSQRQSYPELLVVGQSVAARPVPPVATRKQSIGQPIQLAPRMPSSHLPDLKHNNAPTTALSSSPELQAPLQSQGQDQDYDRVSWEVYDTPLEPMANTSGILALVVFAFFMAGALVALAKRAKSPSDVKLPINPGYQTLNVDQLMTISQSNPRVAMAAMGSRHIEDDDDWEAELGEYVGGAPPVVSSNKARAAKKKAPVFDIMNDDVEDVPVKKGAKPERPGKGKLRTPIRTAGPMNVTVTYDSVFGSYDEIADGILKDYPAPESDPSKESPSSKK